MNDFCRKLLTEWRKLGLPFADETIITAVSGGADSTALALALHELKQRKKLNLRFIVAHFNHDLRGEHSENDAQFVKRLATKLNFELVLGKGKITGEGNLEQNARNKRYEFLRETAANLKARSVLTAHTINDQAETFLMNLIRGSGIEGLGGMKPIRILNFTEQSEIRNPKSEIRLVRPLLNWAKREDTENFCRQSENEFCFDAMNDDLTFQRVRIRKVLLPLLKDFNPKIVENLAKTAELLRGEIEEKSNVANIFVEDSLEIKKIKILSKPLLYKTLRMWLEMKRGNLRQLELKHIQAVGRLISSAKSGRIVELPNGETVLKSGGKLQYKKTKVEK